MYRALKFVPKGIIHVGASKGQEIEQYCQDGVKNVVWIEAIHSVFAKLQSNILAAKVKYPSTNHTPINALVSDVDGSVQTFHLFSNEYDSSSMFAPNPKEWVWPHVELQGKISLVTQRLDSCLKAAKVESKEYDFLVIDVQGAEGLVLKSAGEFLKSIQYLQVEASLKPFYKGGILLPELQAQLKELGFAMVTPQHQINNHCDVVFQRVTPATLTLAATLTLKAAMGAAAPVAQAGVSTAPK